MKWTLNLSTSNYEEPIDPETSDSGEIQKSESERSLINGTILDKQNMGYLISYARIVSIRVAFIPKN